jgi:thiol-disulfide isomerase/thioredoxin
MKKRTLPILFLCFCAITFAQNVIENPKTGLTTAPYLKIKKIELTDTTTTLSLHISYIPGNWINIPTGTYIQPVNNSEKLFITATEGIPLDERYTMPESGEAEFSLVFPAIDKSVTKIDFGEDCDECSWFIYDIHVKPGMDASVLPQEMTGHWYNSASGDWELSLLDKVAIYQNKIWAYDGVNLKSGNGTITLKSANEVIQLHTQVGKNGSQNFGTSAKKLLGYSKGAPSNSKRINDEPYKLPFFNINSATYSGYFINYTPRAGVKTISVHVDDILTGEQNSHVIKISEDGYFSAKLPIYHPQSIWVRSSFYNGSVFLEPGKELFQMIDPVKGPSEMKFMGEPAALNAELLQLNRLINIDYNAMRRTILDMTPDMFKTQYLELQNTNMRAVDSLKVSGNIGEKAYQIKKLDILYRYYSIIMNYEREFEQAYRQKHNIPRTQRDLDVDMEKLTAEYYDFITPEIIHNPLAVLSSDYNSFINRLKFLEILSGESRLSLTALDILNELEKSGHELSKTEQFLKERLEEIEIGNKEFQDKYGKIHIDFATKYKDSIQSVINQGSVFNFESLVQQLNDSGITFTEEEKEFIEANIEFETTDFAKKKSDFFSTHGDSISNIHSKYNEFANKWFQYQGISRRNKNLEEKLGLPHGFAADIMSAQDYGQNIVSRMTSVTDNELAMIQQTIKTPFISEYIAYCNEQTKSKIESNKQRTGYVVNDTPDSEADMLFDKIMEKYRGKIVYVDFWATWCGPCRSGMEQIKPLKAEMAEKDVVFVYITNQTSPLNTWQNMIPGIDGEHYRVSADEWNHFSAKFNVSGIPHYVLVGKSGEILNPKMGFMNNGALKALLEKHVADK